MTVKEAENYLTTEANEYTEPFGKSESLYGELIRAITRFIYRYNTFGESACVDSDYCASGARFLMYNTNEKIAGIMKAMGSGKYEGSYKETLDEATVAVAEYLVENKGALIQKDTDNMEDYTNCYLISKGITPM